jgi:hypothetical protein
MSRRKVLSAVKVCLCSTLRQQQTRSAIDQAVSRRLLIAEVVGSQVIQRGIFFVVDKVALGLVFLRVLRFLLSVSFHRCFVFTHVPSGGVGNGPVSCQFHKDVASSHCNNKNNSKYRPLKSSVILHCSNMTQELQAPRQTSANSCETTDVSTTAAANCTWSSSKPQTSSVG